MNVLEGTFKLLLDDGVVFRSLEIGLSTCGTFIFALGYPGSIRFWETLACVMRRQSLLVVPVCLKTKARTEHLGVFLCKKQVALGLRPKRASGYAVSKGSLTFC